MRAPRIIVRLLALALIVTGLASASVAEDGGFKVIVNPENGASTVDRDVLRDIYLKKTTEWSDGETSDPIDLVSRFPERDRFTDEVIRKTPAQLRTYWNQQIFSGKGVPPPEADSVADVIDYVVANKGAVGYIPADADPGKAKVVRIK